jgi:hypothetical protein
MYDHDEGRAVTGGVAYHGRIAALRGKFVFGDIQNGRLFAADLAELKKSRRRHPADRGADRGDSSCTCATRAASGIGVSMRNWSIRRWARALPEPDLHLARPATVELLLTVEAGWDDSPAGARSPAGSWDPDVQ